MGREPRQKAIVEGFPTERAKVDSTDVSVQFSSRTTVNSIAVQQQASRESTQNSSIAHRIGRLEEWIDGNQVRSVAHHHDAVGFVEMFYETCLDVFQHLWEHIIGTETPFNSKQKSILRESLGRMVLWSDSLRHGELDSILERSDNLKESVLECLVGIAEAIVKEIIPLLSIGAGNTRLLAKIVELISMNEKARFMNSEDYDSDLESTSSDEDVEGGQRSNFPFVQDIASFSECLMDLLHGLERSSKVRQQTPMLSIEPSNVFQVSEPASPFVSLVLDRFRKASPWLAQRLGEANWQRYVRIRAQTRASHEDDALADSVVPISVFNPVSMLPNYEMSTVSYPPSVSSLLDINEGSLRVPDEPSEVALGKPFTCAICSHKLYNIKRRIDWKIHVFADLQPYICTWPECKAGLMTFATRKQWANHEFEQHRVERFWRCQECSAELPSLEDWRHHISNTHSNAVLPKSRLGVSAQLAENSRQMDVKDMTCPMCLEKSGPNRRAFVTHVGEHMEQLALIALTKGVSDESEYDRLSIPTVSSESKQIVDGLAPDSQEKNEFRLPSDHQYPSPDELESLYTEYSSAGGLCSKQGYLLNLTALEQLNHTHQVVPHARLSGDYPYKAASPFAFDFDCACAFCGSQHKGKHQLRMHLIKVHLVEPPLNYQKTGIVSNKKGPGADAIIKCICGTQEDDGIMVICTRCKTWQHNTCYYYWGESLIGFPTSCHECEDCEPRELDAKGAAKRMDFFRRVKYVTLGSIGQESRLLPDPNFDEAQEKHSSNQNPDAFKSKNGSALKKVDSSHSGHSGLSIALDLVFPSL